jgi:hypothetical protein
VAAIASEVRHRRIVPTRTRIAGGHSTYTPDPWRNTPPSMARVDAQRGASVRRIRRLPRRRRRP